MKQTKNQFLRCSSHIPVLSSLQEDQRQDVTPRPESKKPCILHCEACGDDGMLWAATSGQSWPQDHLEPSGSSMRSGGQIGTLQG